MRFFNFRDFFGIAKLILNEAGHFLPQLGQEISETSSSNSVQNHLVKTDFHEIVLLNAHGETVSGRVTPLLQVVKAQGHRSYRDERFSTTVEEIFVLSPFRVHRYLWSFLLI